MQITKPNTAVPASVEEAKARRIQITTVKQAIIAAQKIGINIEELTPYAIDVLWAEIALGRFLRGMEKNKGGGANQYGHFGDLNQREDTNPTVEEIAGNYNKSSLLQKVAKYTDDTIQEYIDMCVEIGVLPKSGDLKSKNTTISKMTGDNEGYTPPEYIEKARRTMGSIDLDPASCDLAQEVVKAEKYYTEDDNGLNKQWIGNIWLNPPYENRLITQFVNKVIAEKSVTQAVLLTNNNTDTLWFRELCGWCDLICFTMGRVKFYKKDGTISAPTNGQAFFYKGVNKQAFCNEFKDVGLIMQRYE